MEYGVRSNEREEPQDVVRRTAVLWLLPRGTPLLSPANCPVTAYIAGMTPYAVPNLALSQRRERADANGCDVALVAAPPGSDAQCHAERMGFRIAYTRTTWRQV